MNETPHVEVRFRRDSDLPTLATVLQAVHKTTGYPVIGIDNPVPFIATQDGLQAWVALLDSRIVGHVLLTHPSEEDMAVKAFVEQGGQLGKVASLARLFVDPSAGGKGLGKMLINGAVKWAADEGMKLVLYVLDKDSSAIGIYEKLGWVRIGEGVFENAEGTVWTAYSYVSPDP
jgi:GNAT superfamily N-acetyltransferase